MPQRLLIKFSIATYKSLEFQLQKLSDKNSFFLAEVLSFPQRALLFGASGTKFLQLKKEGYLTALRANLVNTQNLAALALRLGVGQELFLSKGEEEGGGRENTSLLADTVEAIIGALYLDQGLEAVRAFIKENLVTEIPAKISQSLKDAKSRLQEYVQAKGIPAPKYKVLEESGPDHEKRFVIEVDVNGSNWGIGEGKSKNQAEQAAAEKALEKVV